MKYFKHHTERDREFLDLVFERWGHEGRSVWWALQEVLAVEIERQVDEFKYRRAQFISPVMTVDLKWLAGRCKTSPALVQELAAFANDAGKLSIVKLTAKGTRITIEAPNLLEDSDEYFTKQIARICKDRGIDPKSVPTLSGQCPDTVPTVSDQNKQQQRRRDKNRPAPPPAGAGGDPKPEEPPPPGPPTPPPRVAAAVAVVPESSPVPAPAPGPSVLDRPHYTASMLFLLDVGLSSKAAQSLAATLPVREIAAAAWGARGEGVRDPAAWCRDALRKRYFQSSKHLTPELQQKLLDKIVELEERAAVKLDAMRPAAPGAPMPKREPGESEETFIGRCQAALEARRAAT